MLPTRSRTRRTRGLSAVLMLFVVVITAAIASATVFANVGASKQARGTLDRERALQVAEAGIDWGLARLRITHGTLPNPASEKVALAKSGTFAVRYVMGDTNGLDDDGDGSIDESDEGAYAVVTSTGTVGGISRTIQTVVETPSLKLSLPGATAYVDDTTPLVDINGNAFRISGEEHLIDGTLDPTRDPVWGLSSPADPTILEDQLRDKTESLVTGAGGSPSVGQIVDADFAGLLEMARASTTVSLAPGTHTDGELGSPTPEGVQVVHCAGDLHLSGNVGGAGILVVDGDLTITGEFTWVGIVVVEGRVRLNGGGSTIRLIGSVAVGDEITDSLSVAGTVDLYYSSDAKRLAELAMAVPVLRTWRETANP